jgi:hypothetical protein
MVGTGAAALTGLVFVAMSLNVGAIKGDTAHRYRASGSLTGLASVFVLSGLVLMGGQHHRFARPATGSSQLPGGRPCVTRQLGR